jgi:hypothetical protein
VDNKIDPKAELKDIRPKIKPIGEFVSRWFGTEYLNRDFIVSKKNIDRMASDFKAAYDKGEIKSESDVSSWMATAGKKYENESKENEAMDPTKLNELKKKVLKSDAPSKVKLAAVKALDARCNSEEKKENEITTAKEMEANNLIRDSKIELESSYSKVVKARSIMSSRDVSDTVRTMVGDMLHKLDTLNSALKGFV